MTFLDRDGYRYLQVVEAYEAIGKSHLGATPKSSSETWMNRCGYTAISSDSVGREISIKQSLG
jgi:hypothetical protein